MSAGGPAIALAALSPLPADASIRSMFFMDSIPMWTPPSQYSLLPNAAIQVSYAAEGMSGPTGLGVPTPNDYAQSVFLQSFFNVSTTIVKEQLYGNIADGTARAYYQPYGNHPQSTETPESITNCVTWFELTNPTSTTLANSDMMFPWKQFFLSVSFAAAIVFMFTFGSYMLQTKSFEDLVEPLPEYKGSKGIGYWIGAIIVTALGPLLFLWGWENLGELNLSKLISGTILPLANPNAYISWFNLTAVASLVILLAAYFLYMRKAGVTLNDLGFGWSMGKIAKSLVFAVLTMVPIYAALVYSYVLWHMPFTLSLVGLPQIPIVLEPLNLTRTFFLTSYFPAILPIFIIYGVIFAGFMRPKSGNVSLAKEMIINSLILSVGSIVLLLYVHIPQYTGMQWTLTWPLVTPPPGTRGRLYILHTDAHIQRDRSVPSDILLQEDWQNLVWRNDDCSFRHVVPRSHIRLFSGSNMNNP